MLVARVLRSGSALMPRDDAGRCPPSVGRSSEVAYGVFLPVPSNRNTKMPDPVGLCLLFLLFPPLRIREERRLLYFLHTLQPPTL